VIGLVLKATVLEGQVANISMETLAMFVVIFLAEADASEGTAAPFLIKFHLNPSLKFV